MGGDDGGDRGSDGHGYETRAKREAGMHIENDARMQNLSRPTGRPL
jgi:hypothetical protein